MTPELEIQILRFIGSALGAVLAFLVIWPTSVTDAARRFAASMIFGVVTGPVFRSYAGMAETAENRLASAAFCGFIAWTVLPVILKAAGGIDWGKWFRK